MMLISEPKASIIYSAVWRMTPSGAASQQHLINSECCFAPHSPIFKIKGDTPKVTLHSDYWTWCSQTSK